jgi:hypothetical protein
VNGRSLKDYPDKFCDGPSCDAGSAERMLRAIGDAMLVGVRKYPELIRFSNNGTAPGNWPTEGRVETKPRHLLVFVRARKIYSVECPSFGCG